MEQKKSRGLLRAALTLALLALVAVPQLAFEAHAAGTAVMEVTAEGKTTSYADFDSGWSAAVDTAEGGEPVRVKLLADWVAPDGNFEYSSGTDEGCLCLADGDIDLTVDLNGYTIDRNRQSATTYGQVFWIDDGSLTVTDSSAAQTGKITGGWSDSYGGGIYVDYGKFYLLGGSITRNWAQNGGGICCDDAADAFVYIRGGKVTNNGADQNGGGIYAYNGPVYIEGGEISLNWAQEGGGIYWASRDELCMTGGQIVSNAAFVRGGGVYATDWGDIYVGGSIKITDNTGSNGEDNLYLNASNVDLNPTAGQDDNVPNVPFQSGAQIGLSVPEVKFEEVISATEFTTDGALYITSDDPTYRVYSQNDGSGYKLWLGAAYQGCMYVTPDGQATRTFTDFGKGWVYAIQQDVHTTVKLGGNWVAPHGMFYFEDEDGDECGTYNGYGCLYLNLDDLTLDLNGYTIDRNLDSAVTAGSIIYGSHSDLVIVDSSQAQTGKITGGKNAGDGGAIEMLYSNVVLRGGRICGNEAEQGGALHIAAGSFTMEGGEISGNHASKNGGAIYNEPSQNKDHVSVIAGGRIVNNTAGECGGGIYMDAGFLHVTGGEICDNTADGNGGGICLPDFPTAETGIATLTGGTISGNLARGRGGGVALDDFGAAYVGGTVCIRGNRAGGADDNLSLLHSDAELQHAVGQADEVPNAPFAPGAYIGINAVDSLGDDLLFSSSDSYFAADAGSYIVADRADFAVRTVPDTDDSDHPYKLYLSRKDEATGCTIYFLGNGGGGSMASVTLAQYSTYTLPECGFTAPDGTVFCGWSINGTDYAPGDKLQVTGGLTVVARWQYEMPAVTFEATGADSGVLSGCAAGMQYSTDGGNHWTACTDGTVTLSGLAHGGTVKIVRVATNDNWVSSEPQVIRIIRAQPLAGITAVAACQGTGGLRGLAKGLEYSADGLVWIAVTGSEVMGLAPGTYYVRTAAAGTILASQAVALEVEVRDHDYVDGTCTQCGQPQQTGTENPFVFSQNANIWLIEPWALRANLALYHPSLDGSAPAGDPLTKAEYESLVQDYGVYFIRESDLDVDASALTKEDIINDPDAVHKTKANGVYYDNSKNRLYSDFDEGIYTYELSDSIFVLYYIVENGNTHYATIRERNLSEMVNTMKDQSQYAADEREVYAQMAALERDIVAYRGQWENPDALPIMDVPEMRDITWNYRTLASTVAGYSQAVVLIEPWGLELKGEVAEGISSVALSDCEDFGVIVYYDTVGNSPITSVEEMLAKADAKVFSYQNGDAAIVGSNKVTALYNSGIYTYQMGKTAYVMFYFMDEDTDTLTCGSVKSYSILDVIAKVQAKNISELENNVYESMKALNRAIIDYRTARGASN